MFFKSRVGFQEGTQCLVLDSKSDPTKQKLAMFAPASRSLHICRTEMGLSPHSGGVNIGHLQE